CSGRGRGSRRARAVRREGARAQLPDEPHEAPPARRLGRSGSRSRRDRGGTPAKALGDCAQQLCGPGAEAAGMLLLEHGDERPHLSLSEAHAPGLERTIEANREVAVAFRDSRAGCSRGSKLTHDVARNADDLAVQVDLDRWCYGGSMVANSRRASYLRGLKEYTFT